MFSVKLSNLKFIKNKKIKILSFIYNIILPLITSCELAYVLVSGDNDFVVFPLPPALTNGKTSKHNK